LRKSTCWPSCWCPAGLCTCACGDVPVVSVWVGVGSGVDVGVYS